MTPSTAKPSVGFQRVLSAIAEQLKKLEGTTNVQRLEFTVFFDKGQIGTVHIRSTTEH